MTKARFENKMKNERKKQSANPTKKNIIENLHSNEYYKTIQNMY